MSKEFVLVGIQLVCAGAGGWLLGMRHWILGTAVIAASFGCIYVRSVA